MQQYIGFLIIDSDIQYLVEKVLSRYATHSNQTLIFIPSYFDYVQLRNIFYQKQKAGELTFGTMCEYSSEKHIAQERTAAIHRK